MSKTFQVGVAAIEALSEVEQEEAGEILLALATRRSSAPYRLTHEQEVEVRAALTEAGTKDFSTDEQVAAFWKSAGV